MQWQIFFFLSRLSIKVSPSRGKTVHALTWMYSANPFIILMWVIETFVEDERLIALIDRCASPPPPLASGQLEVIMDRRLMQDDNRGLGQGLKDNKKTSNRFRLLLERRMTGNKVRKMRTGVLIQNYTAPLCWLMYFQTLCSSHCGCQHPFSCSFFCANTPSVLFLFSNFVFLLSLHRLQHDGIFAKFSSSFHYFLSKILSGKVQEVTLLRQLCDLT